MEILLVIVVFILSPYYLYGFLWAFSPLAAIASAIIALITRQRMVNFTLWGTVLFISGGILWLQLLMRAFNRSLYYKLVRFSYFCIFVVMAIANLNWMAIYITDFGVIDWGLTNEIENEILKGIIDQLPLICLFGSLIAFIRYWRFSRREKLVIKIRHECHIERDDGRVCIDCATPFMILMFWCTPLGVPVLFLSLIGSSLYLEYLAVFLALASAISTLIWLSLLAYRKTAVSIDLALPINLGYSNSASWLDVAWDPMPGMTYEARIDGEGWRRTSYSFILFRGLQPDTSYVVDVRGVDSNGNRSEAQTITATTRKLGQSDSR